MPRFSGGSCGEGCQVRGQRPGEGPAEGRPGVGQRTVLTKLQEREW